MAAELFDTITKQKEVDKTTTKSTTGTTSAYVRR